jgi:hypothetical protein
VFGAPIISFENSDNTAFAFVVGAIRVLDALDRVLLPPPFGKGDVPREHKPFAAAIPSTAALENNSTRRHYGGKLLNPMRRTSHL